MNWFQDKPDQWREILKTVAAETSRLPQMVEKDTIQSMFLSELSSCEVPLVFKGGTSLSKCYNLINRFSEDIDLSLDHSFKESEGRKIKSAIISCASLLGFSLSNPEEVLSKHKYNKYIFEYPSLFDDLPREFLVETSFFQSAYPVSKQQVGSYVGDFCMSQHIILPVPFNTAPVEMLVQSYERTFIDKVFAVCDYRLQGINNRVSRHLYDIAKLYPLIKFTPELDELIDQVRIERLKVQGNIAANLEYNIPSLLQEIVDSHYYETDYNNISRKLLYEDVSYETVVKNGIEKVAKMNIFNYNYDYHSKCD